MNYGTFDIEAMNWIEFGVMGCFDGDSYKHFYRIGDFLNHISQKKYNNWRWYAHNGGKYDDKFLLDPIFARKWKVKMIERSDRIISLNMITDAGVRVNIVDSYALLTASLKKLSDSFKPEHQKKEYDVSNLKKHHFHDPKLLRYLENDCRSLYEILEMFFKQEFIDQPQLTIASQALNTFRKKFLKSDMYRVRLDDELIFREQFYAGGRVEVFKGRGVVNCYDVNSLFPSVMLQPMPVGECRHTERFWPGKIGFYVVDVLATPDFYVSPYLVKTQKRNYYLNGPGRYFLSSAMLTELKTTYGVRFKVVKGWVFDGKECLFNEYVEYFYGMKQKAKASHDDVSYMLSKLFLNALYGKLGASRWRQSVEQWDGSQKAFQKFNNPIADQYGLVLVPQESKSKFILPYLAAYITDLARLAHWKLMQRSPEKMFYCDTDSLYTAANYDDLLSDRIGDLSFEGTWDGIFIAPKTYALKAGKQEKIKFKGFDSKEFTFRSMRDFQETSKPLSFTQERILGFRESMIRTTGIIRQRGNFLKMVNTTKTVKSEYDGRQIDDSKRFLFDSYPKRYDEIVTGKEAEKRSMQLDAFNFFTDGK
jgi:hypothetical protein